MSAIDQSISPLLLAEMSRTQIGWGCLVLVVMWFVGFTVFGWGITSYRQGALWSGTALLLVAGDCLLIGFMPFFGWFAWWYSLILFGPALFAVAFPLETDGASSGQIRQESPRPALSPRTRAWMAGGLAAAAAVLAISGWFAFSYQPSSTISETFFKEQIRQNNIVWVKMGKQEATGQFKVAPASGVQTESASGGNPPRGQLRETFFVVLPANESAAAHIRNLLDEHRVEVENTKWADSAQVGFTGLWGGLLALLVILLVVYFLARSFVRRLPGSPRDVMSEFGASPLRWHEPDEPGATTFADVGGLQAAKDELQVAFQFLRDPGAFEKIGARCPRGFLLEGPPGTGKTLLARAVASAAGVPFAACSGSEFIEMLVGVGALRIRDMFAEVRAKGACILFIDELDAIGQRRDGPDLHNRENDQTLAQLLSEMDGFKPRDPVLIIAATNRRKALDAALVRPGRFDKHLTIALPSYEDRLAILKIHAKKLTLSDDVDLDSIARFAVGMNGAELEAITNEAALLAVKEERPNVDQLHCLQAARKQGAVVPELTDELALQQKLGQRIRGQQEAIAGLARAVAHHYSDLRGAWDHDKQRVSKSNAFLCGPPGTGKSALVERIAELVEVPMATLEAAVLLADPSSIREALGRLYDAAKRDERRAEFGILCICGMEQLLNQDVRAGLALSAEDEICRAMAGTSYDVPQDHTQRFSPTVSIHTRHILFICEAALSLSRAPIRERLRGAGAFAANGALRLHESLASHGFSRRLLASLPIAVSTQPLERDDLRAILGTVIEQYQARMTGAGKSLEVPPDAQEAIVTAARRRDGGARALSQVIEEVLASGRLRHGAAGSPPRLVITPGDVELATGAH